MLDGLLAAAAVRVPAVLDRLQTEPHVAPIPAPLRPLSNRVEHGLFYGNSKKPLVRVVPDDRPPKMWRMHWPDGRVSDMANLARIKDAAMDICGRGPPELNRRRFHWVSTAE